MTSYLGWLTVILFLLLIMKPLVRIINKELFHSQNNTLKATGKLLGKIHPFMAAAMILLGFIHGFMLMGEITFHHGYLLWIIILTISIIAALGKISRIRWLLKLHKSLILVLIAILLYHILKVKFFI